MSRRCRGLLTCRTGHPRGRDNTGPGVSVANMTSPIYELCDAYTERLAVLDPLGLDQLTSEWDASSAKA
jgi:hypothetical protein